jgi:hypothetical protein
MQQKNTLPFMVCKNVKGPCNFNAGIFFVLCCSLLLLTSSCKKLKLLSGDQSTLEQYFADNVLGKTFVVDFASDSSVNITNQYTGYDFILTKTTSFYDGNMTGTKDGITYTGTWASNSDYSKLVINLNSSNIPSSFIFLNRSWKFTKKGVPVLELAPWGSIDPKILHMRRL